MWNFLPCRRVPGEVEGLEDQGGEQAPVAAAAGMEEAGCCRCHHKNVSRSAFVLLQTFVQLPCKLGDELKSILLLSWAIRQFPESV